MVLMQELEGFDENRCCPSFFSFSLDMANFARSYFITNRFTVTVLEPSGSGLASWIQNVSPAVIS